MRRREFCVLSAALLAGCASNPRANWREHPPAPNFALFASPDGDDDDDGGEFSPMRTIQAALDKAGPGCAVRVRAGAYSEAVRFPSRHGGYAQSPIWLISHDGPGAARISPGDRHKSAIKGLGVFNIVVDGFALDGCDNGVQFSQSGADFTAPCRNILIRNCRISDCAQDGVKVSQTDNVAVVDNVIDNCAEQCVDYFNVRGGLIARNQASRANVAGAIVVKGGSVDVKIAQNQVAHVRGRSVCGIVAGGWSTPGLARPGSPEAEATQVSIESNEVSDVDGYALAFLGAHDCVARDNSLDAAAPGNAPVAFALIGFARGSPHGVSSLCRNILVERNRLSDVRPPFSWERTYQDPERDQLVVRDNVGLTTRLD